MKIVSLINTILFVYFIAGFSHAQNPIHIEEPKFEDWDYKLIERPLVIKGQFIGVDPDSIEMEFGRIIYNHLVEGEQVINLYEVSDSGSFHIIFPLMRPQEIMITLPYHFGNVYASPGKTTSFTFDVLKSKNYNYSNREEIYSRPAPMTFNGELAEFNNHFNQLNPIIRKTFFWPDNKKLQDSLDQWSTKWPDSRVWKDNSKRRNIIWKRTIVPAI